MKAQSEEQSIWEIIRGKIEASKQGQDKGQKTTKERSDRVLFERAELLSRSINQKGHLDERTYLFFTCCENRLAINAESSHGFLKQATLFAVPTLGSRGVFLTVLHGEQLPVFEIGKELLTRGGSHGDVLILGSDKPDFGLVIEEVSLEVLPITTFMENISKKNQPLLRNADAIDAGGRMLLTIDALLDDPYFNI